MTAGRHPQPHPQPDYIQNLTIQVGNSGPILGTPSDPRTYGVMVRYRL